MLYDNNWRLRSGERTGGQRTRWPKNLGAKLRWPNGLRPIAIYRAESIVEKPSAFLSLQSGEFLASFTLSHEGIVERSNEKQNSGAAITGITFKFLRFSGNYAIGDRRRNFVDRTRNFDLENVIYVNYERSTVQHATLLTVHYTPYKLKENSSLSLISESLGYGILK